MIGQAGTAGRAFGMIIAFLSVFDLHGFILCLIVGDGLAVFIYGHISLLQILIILSMYLRTCGICTNASVL